MLLSNWLGSSPRCFALNAATLASCSAMLARASANWLSRKEVVFSESCRCAFTFSAMKSELSSPFTLCASSGDPAE